MKFETKYWILKLKAYFDKGMSVTHYVRWLILFFGISSQDTKQTMTLGFAYIFLCGVVGYCWFKFGWILAEAEVGNRHNMLSKDLRKFLKKKKV